MEEVYVKRAVFYSSMLLSCEGLETRTDLKFCTMVT